LEAVAAVAVLEMVVAVLEMVVAVLEMVVAQQLRSRS
jgi:hypothetical protein